MPIETTYTSPADMAFLNAMLENIHIKVGTAHSPSGVLFYWLKDNEKGYQFNTTNPNAFDHELEACIDSRN